MSAVPASTRRHERFAARLSAARKARLQRAADLTGRSLTDFVIAAAEREAEETIRRHEIIELSARDSPRLAEALLNPPAPNDALLAAWEDYRTFPAARA